MQVQHLASHLLGQMARIVPLHFQQLYAHPIWMFETFVDPERFRGTCYRAANWVSLGTTTGRGKNNLTHQATRSIKEVLVLPLHRQFRELLRANEALKSGCCIDGKKNLGSPKWAAG